MVVEMEKRIIYEKIQRIVQDVPVLLVGTGLSIPFGIPGMSDLANHLLNRLREKYVEDASWVVIAKRLEEGKDLESAMTDLTPSPSSELTDDIVNETWNLINNHDLQCGLAFLEMKQSAFSRLLNHLYKTSSAVVNVITTNYDRFIEYSCDKAKIPVTDGFSGYCYKRFSLKNFSTRNTVNLVKVHGSLDYFKTKIEETCSIPLQQRIPDGYLPDIITPGSDKYRHVLRGVHRDLLQQADSYLELAPAFLCIGYGFNDEQIQEKLLSGLRSGKPILVVTKCISDQALALISNSSSNYVVITDGGDETTVFNINGIVEEFEGKFWTMDGLMQIVTGE